MALFSRRQSNKLSNRNRRRTEIQDDPNNQQAVGLGLRFSRLRREEGFPPPPCSPPVTISLSHLPEQKRFIFHRLISPEINEWLPTG